MSNLLAYGMRKGSMQKMTEYGTGKRTPQETHQQAVVVQANIGLPARLQTLTILAQSAQSGPNGQAQLHGQLRTDEACDGEHAVKEGLAFGETVLTT